jgi:hypothetical protein
MARCNQCGAVLTKGEEYLVGDECECGGDFVEDEPPPSLPARLAAALAALPIGVGDLERRLGLSQGYLSQCRPGGRRTPARHLVLLLEALVRHPEDLDVIAD